MCVTFVGWFVTILHSNYSIATWSLKLSGGKQKGKKQKTVKVEGIKEKSEPFGLLLSKRAYTSDKALGVRHLDMIGCIFIVCD